MTASRTPPRLAPSPLVSVVIPTRNRSQLLRRALASLLQQTYDYLEIIVVDDASTDDTERVVADMGDPRIRYLRREESGGGAAARNVGIRAATGSVIGFLDDDDEWDPAKTEAQLKLLRYYPAVICASNKSGDLARFRKKKTVDAKDFRRGKFTAGGTGVLMARAGVIKSIGFDETLPRYQDWDLFIRIAKRYTIGYLNRPLVRYNEGDHPRITNSLLQCPAEELERQFRMLNKHRDFLGPRFYRRHMSRALLYGIKHRRDGWKVLRYVMCRYGPINACAAIGIRMRAILHSKLVQRQSASRVGV